MAEKQPTSYVVCRYKVFFEKDGDIEYVSNCGDNIPVKVFDTRREAREYVKRMSKRSKHYDYNYFSVKQG